MTTEQPNEQWLRLNNIAHFRVPNETYTKSWSQKAKNKALAYGFVYGKNLVAWSKS